jgi:ribosomal protein S18 acetylase RimI-like enzyme
MQRTYRELDPGGEFSHLADTVDQYFSRETPLWWIAVADSEVASSPIAGSSGAHIHPPIACLWLGTAIDQMTGHRHTHIFLLYVAPEHRRRGVGSMLMHQAEVWARQRGDRQIGLQVFQSNQAALSLYHRLGYQSQSVWMVKVLQ